MQDLESGRLSAAAYFGCVVLVTLAGWGLAMLARPSFAHGVMQTMGLEAVPKAEGNSFYIARVAPLFQTHCVSCHGTGRQKASLRLDGFAAALLGGKHGAVVRPGDARNSELVSRISLPASDDKAMPPSGKTPLTPDDVTVIRLWIAHGASGSLRDIPGAPRPVVEVQLPKDDPAAVQRLRAPLAAAVRQLQNRFPGVIDYEARNSADLVVDASLKGAGFGDSQLQALAPLAGHIVSADLSGTAITDASAASLAAMPHLRSLRLSGTKLSDTSLHALEGAKSLRSLAVVGAHISASALASFRARGVAVYEGGDGP